MARMANSPKKIVAREYSLGMRRRLDYRIATEVEGINLNGSDMIGDTVVQVAGGLAIP